MSDADRVLAVLGKRSKIVDVAGEDHAAAGVVGRGGDDRVGGGDAIRARQGAQPRGVSRDDFGDLAHVALA